ncbi:MAG: DUF433 domain-containing protein [Planctomycetes bacterium]|nr:DUF433 domain-containing protein [Planctomycetota bacterium]
MWKSRRCIDGRGRLPQHREGPDRCGGRAVVAGTRIRVSVILTCYRQGMTVEEIVQQYPHLKPADVHDALAYAYEHPDEIAADVADEDEEAAKQRWPSGPAASLPL